MDREKRGSTHHCIEISGILISSILYTALYCTALMLVRSAAVDNICQGLCTVTLFLLPLSRSHSDSHSAPLPHTLTLLHLLLPLSRSHSHIHSTPLPHARLHFSSHTLTLLHLLLFHSYFTPPPPSPTLSLSLSLH